ncbi:MAG: ribosome biogenesis GTPase Der [Christensenellaceae bacterium]|jgi:GTP-binding protein|nr:ribosome biogenesis GTPase Der [Christensenellaceae bacterium]
MSNKIVAIVGRPNVGKSTFFNRMAGKRISIVNNKAGVTRDRIYADVEWCGYKFTLIDTGGITPADGADIILKHIRRQAEVAVEMCDIIIFMVDGKAGVSPDDYEIADYIRKSGKPIILVVNKIDGSDESPIYDFYNLDLGEPMSVSSEHGLGTGDVLDAVTLHLGGKEPIEDDENKPTAIAILGKPNAGKSSLVNKILGYERVIVSEIAGTTRDAVDTKFTYEGKEYILIDTAGIRKKSRVDDDIEYYSVVRALTALKRADVVVIVMDATENVSEQDVKICGLAHNEGKPSLIVMNKWDLIDKTYNTTQKYEQRLAMQLKFMDYMKTTYISALTGKRANTLLSLVNVVLENANRRISTGILNDIIGDSIAVNEPPNKRGQKLKVFYVTQASTKPPTFLFFVNEPEIVHFSYKRYLENSIRKAVDFTGTPIRLIFRKNESNQQ